MADMTATDTSDQEASAPPTPSQDAEGDGLAEFVPDPAYAGGFGDGYEVGYQEAESAIRAPYEELVKAARAQHAPCKPFIKDGKRGCDTHMVWWPEGTDCGYDPVNGALTYIEESLGGRKDG